MIREKRIIKKPNNFANLYEKPNSNSNKGKNKNRNLKRCNFQMVPLPLYVKIMPKIYQLYGDITLVNKSNILTTEISALTKFHTFRSIQVTQKSATKLIHVLAEHKDAIQITPWESLVNELESSKSSELKEWALIIKEFSIKSEEILQILRQNGSKITNNEQEEKLYAQTTENSQKKKSQLLEFLPCFCLKFGFDGKDISLSEIIFNNLFLRELGYSIDSFITYVFQEGIPQFISHDEQAFSAISKLFLENYFKLGLDGFITQEFNLPVFMKSKYVKNIQAQAHFLRNYEEGSFGVDMVFTMNGKSEPFYHTEIISKTDLSNEFLNIMTKQEQAQALFLSLYYEKSFTSRYSNFDKVCTIKELPLINEEETIFHQ